MNDAPCGTITFFMVVRSRFLRFLSGSIRKLGRFLGLSRDKILCMESLGFLVV